MEEGQQEKLPSVFQLLKPAWELLRVNTTVIIGVIATPLLVSVPLFILLLVISGAVTAGGGTLSVGTVNAFGVLLVAIYIVLTATGVVVNIALMIVTLKAARGEKLSFTETFRAAWPYFFRVLGLYAVVSIAVIIGLALLIVPGLILLRRYFLASYYVVDRNLGIFAAMDASADESKRAGGVWGLIGFALVIILLGFIPHVGWVPAVIASILYTCMITWRYIQITARITPPAELEPTLVPKLGEVASEAAAGKPKAAKKNPTAKHKTKKAGARKNRSHR
jgi:hypothetical protein